MADPPRYWPEGSHPQYTGSLLPSLEDGRYMTANSSMGIDEAVTGGNTDTVSTTHFDMPNSIPMGELSNGMPFQNQNWNGSGFSVLSGNPSRPSSSGLNNDSHFQDSSWTLQSPQPLPTRKRQRNNYSPNLLTGESPDPKSRKPTPVGLPAAAASSSSSRPPSRLSESNRGDLGELLGLSDDTFSDIQREQLEAERQLEERMEQERRDAEFARFLDDEGEQSRAISASPAPSVSTLASLPPKMGPNSPVTQGGPSRHPGTTATGSGYMNSTFRQFSGTKVPEFLSNRSNQAYIDISSDSDDIEEIRSSDFPTSNRAPAQAQAPGPTTSSWNLHQAAVIDGRSWPTIDPRYPGFKRDERIFGPAGPRSLEAKPSGPFPNAPWQASYDSVNSWRHSTIATGSSMPGAFPTDGSEQYPAASVGIGFPRPGSQPPYFVDPSKTNDELKKLLETIRPDGDLENREGTPEALKYPLMEHQKLGLAWMKAKEEGSNRGGILADDMGLGKTIQALALMVSRPSNDPHRKTTLIIAPVALLQQWKREIERLLRPDKHQISVFVLHGDKRAAKSSTFDNLKKYDVIMTTFGTIASEFKRKASFGNKPEDHPMSPSFPLLGSRSKFYRVIIDEAQCIKNKDTKAAQACCLLNSTYKWCMSGTPMMNGVHELYSLIKFLDIPPYNDSGRFNSTFTRPLKTDVGSIQENAMQKLQALLKAILLRRTKSSKINGKPILQLPPRTTEESHAVFSEDEQQFYNALETRTQLQFNRYLHAGTVGRNYSSILVLLLRLRQACCHPHLITDFGVKAAVNADEVDLVANAKNFDDEVVLRLKENESSECPVCIDAVENAIIFFPCGHSTCAECFTRISDPAQALAQGNDGGAYEIKCPNCRGKVDTKKITDSVSFKSVYCPDQNAGTLEETAAKIADMDDDSDDSSDDSDDEDDDGSDLRDFIVPDDDAEAAEQRPRKKKDRKGKGKAQDNPIRSLALLKKEGMKNAKAKRKYLKKLARNWQTSAKVDQALEILEKIEGGNDGQKTIIFSQFTSLLDLLEVPIMRRGWGYRRYDGSMKPGDRNQSVFDFTDKPDCKIMLVSLKAGNSGLNLVAASNVIIFDPFWNPYIEEQAIDRAHRIGQMRPVQVHRILIKDTVEDRIVALQEKKRKLIEGALDEKASKNVGRLGTQELAFLFGVNN